MFWNKKEKHCKCHNDLEELQKLSEELKEAQKEIDKTKYERVLKSLKDYIDIPHYDACYFAYIDKQSDKIAKILSFIIYNGGRERDILSDSDLALAISDYLLFHTNIATEKEFYYDLGQFFIKMSEATESLEMKENKIKELEKQIKDKKAKLGIL